MIKKLLSTMLIGTLAFAIPACTRIDDGMAGISQGRMSGEISEQVMSQGWKQTFTQSIIKVSTRNIIIPIETNPVIKEGIPMAKFDVKVNYGIVPTTAPYVYKTESSQHSTNPENGDLYLLGKYVEYVARSSISDVVRQYSAMDVNQKRDEIEAQIKETINRKLVSQGKAKFVKVNEINILAIEPPKSIVTSVENIIKTENDKKAKVNEVETARLEQEKMEILAKQADTKYIQLMQAQSQVNFSEAAKISASKGQFMPMLVPYGFNGNVTVSK